MPNGCNIDRIGYNLYSGFSNFGYNILYYLMCHNEKIWKLLKYNTPDALSKPDLMMAEKRKMIYNGTGDSENYNVYRSPFLDDAFTAQTSQLRIYPRTVTPKNRSIGIVDIAIDCITHSKLVNLNDYKSRPEVMVEEVISTLNGQDIDGVGQFFFDATNSPYDGARADIFNNRYFFGFSIIMSVKIGSLGFNEF